MHGAGTVSVLFVTMVPQTVVSMMSLTPPVMADDVVTTLGLPAGAAGFYTGLIYSFVLITNIVAAPLIARFGPLRACPGASESTLRWRGPVLVRNGAGLACRNDRR